MRARCVACLALLAVTTPAPAQEAHGTSRPCEIVMTGVRRGPDTTRVRMFTSPTGERITYVGGGVDATCAGQGNRLLADSAEHYDRRGVLILFHNVRYSEERIRLTSDQMTYYTIDERLLAEGNVRGTSASGMRFRGPEMEYFRAKPGLRDEPRWRAPGRPFVRMAVADEAPERPPRLDSLGHVVSDSVDLTANVITSRNDSLVWASGEVIIERHDVRATSDSALMDNGTGWARLLRAPVIVGRGERPFTMEGVIIDLWSRDRDLERVLAAGEAEVVSDSMTLTADTIDVRLAERQIERVYSWGGRSRADSPQQRVDADSLDILMPGQRISELRAVGAAVATSRADTARVDTEEPDWIAGDTLVARFDTATVADSAAQPRMREVVATGSARSFYQLAPSAGAKGLPNISYNRGRVITVSFVAGEVTTVQVDERASGIFLEPVRADTTARRPTAGAAPRRP